MSLILLILQIISAIPTIITIIHDIINLIHGLPVRERKAAEVQLTGLLEKHLVARNASAAQLDLEQFHDDLKGKYGV